MTRSWVISFINELVKLSNVGPPLLLRVKSSVRSNHHIEHLISISSISGLSYTQTSSEINSDHISIVFKS